MCVRVHCLQARDMLEWPGLLPLYMSTLLQLGLVPNRGIPGLVVSRVCACACLRVLAQAAALSSLFWCDCIHVRVMYPHRALHVHLLLPLWLVPGVFLGSSLFSRVCRVT
jgi:hypothetical protein